jgi:hypothetical protein
MPALLTKMSSVPKASVVLATAARSSSAEALSAFRGNAINAFPLRINGRIHLSY